jgi:hypothetical protein
VRARTGGCGSGSSLTGASFVVGEDVLAIRGARVDSCVKVNFEGQEARLKVMVAGRGAPRGLEVQARDIVLIIFRCLLV